MMGAAIREAIPRLEEAGVPSPRADAVTLMAQVMGSDNEYVERHSILGLALTRDQEEHFRELIDQRCERIPLQHITGTQAFRRLILQVGPGVFIPRPETETVAELALDAARLTESPGAPRVADLCSGSGALALSIKDELPGCDVAGVEISSDAVAWARQNAAQLALDVLFVEADATGDLGAVPALQGWYGTCDVVVSNPPYIPNGAVPRDPEVQMHDPELALYGGSDDGLRIPLDVARTAASMLRPGGVLVMEHADVQGESIVHALQAQGLWESVTDHVDLNGRPRAARAVRAQ